MKINPARSPLAYTVNRQPAVSKPAAPFPKVQTSTEQTQPAQNSVNERGIIIVGGKPAEDRGIIIVGGKADNTVRNENGILYVGGRSVIR